MRGKKARVIKIESHSRYNKAITNLSYVNDDVIFPEQKILNLLISAIIYFNSIRDLAERKKINIEQNHRFHSPKNRENQTARQR